MLRKPVLNTINCLGTDNISLLHIWYLFTVHIVPLRLHFFSQVCSAWYDLNVGWMVRDNGKVELKIIRYAELEGCVYSCSAVILADIITTRRRRLSHIVQRHHWGNASQKNKKTRTRPLLSKPKVSVFYDLDSLTLPQYEWKRSPVWQLKIYSPKT